MTVSSNDPDSVHSGRTNPVSFHEIGEEIEHAVEAGEEVDISEKDMNTGHQMGEACEKCFESLGEDEENFDGCVKDAYEGDEGDAEGLIEGIHQMVYEMEGEMDEEALVQTGLVRYNPGAGYNFGGLGNLR